MSKTKIVEQFKQALHRIHEHLDAEHWPMIQQAERAFCELRQQHSATQTRAERAEADLQAARRESQIAKQQAEELRRTQESLGQQFQNKDAEAGRLRQALRNAEALLIEQRTKGFNAQMIEDFLAQLEMDLRTALAENEHPVPVGTPHPQESKLRYFFEKYGQYGGFVPMSVGNMPTEIYATFRAQNTETYRTELGHLLALKDRFAFALECCKRPLQQYRRYFIMDNDGSVTKEDKWEDFDAVVKSHRKQ